MIKNLFKKHRHFLPLERTDWFIVLTGIAVFTAISLFTIGNSSIWFDEAFGAYLIQFNLFDIAVYTGADVHPPFYYWLLKLWDFIFGHSEFALRSTSVLFGGVAIFFAYALVRKLFTRQAAWLALVFMAIAPMFIRYSQEMRMYALVSAIAFAATYVLVYAMEQKKRLPWVIYGILVALGMWTHYFSALVWLSHWAWRAWVVRSEHGPKKRWRAFFTKDWVVAHIVAVALFLPWLPFLVKQAFIVQVAGFWIPPVTPATLPNFFTNILYYQDQDTVNPWTTLILMVVAVSIITLAVRLWRSFNKKERQNYALIFALAFMPVIILFVISMPPVQSYFIDRYLVPATLGISAFIGVTIALSKFTKPVLQKGLTVLVAGAMIFGIFNVYQLGNYNKTLHSSNGTRQLMNKIKAAGANGEPIIADSPWLFYEAIFYNSTQHPVKFIDATVDYRYGSLDMLYYNDQHKIKDLEAFTKSNKTLWFMGRPGEANLVPPSTTWKQLKQVEVHDTISGKPLYKAVQYQVN